jgi:hypothetical protein
MVRHMTSLVGSFRQRQRMLVHIYVYIQQTASWSITCRQPDTEWLWSVPPVTLSVAQTCGAQVHCRVGQRVYPTCVVQIANDPPYRSILTQCKTSSSPNKQTYVSQNTHTVMRWLARTREHRDKNRRRMDVHEELSPPHVRRRLISIIKRYDQLPLVLVWRMAFVARCFAQSTVFRFFTSGTDEVWVSIAFMTSVATCGGRPVFLAALKQVLRSGYESHCAVLPRPITRMFDPQSQSNMSQCIINEWLSTLSHPLFPVAADSTANHTPFLKNIAVSVKVRVNCSYPAFRLEAISLLVSKTCRANPVFCRAENYPLGSAFIVVTGSLLLLRLTRMMVTGSTQAQIFDT